MVDILLEREREMMEQREEEEGRKELREEEMNGRGQEDMEEKGEEDTLKGRKKWMESRRGEVKEDGREVKSK